MCEAVNKEVTEVHGNDGLLILKDKVKDLQI